MTDIALEARKGCWCETTRKPCGYHEGFGDGVERLEQKLDALRPIAANLAAELRKWGWGDFHYGHRTLQEQSVLDALAPYDAYMAEQS